MAIDGQSKCMVAPAYETTQWHRRLGLGGWAWWARDLKQSNLGHREELRYKLSAQKNISVNRLTTIG